MKSSGPVVWLQADPVTLAARIGHAPGRPLLKDVDVVERLSQILAIAGMPTRPPPITSSHRRLDGRGGGGAGEKLWNAS